jgi:signal transduction histidine kinase
MDSRWAKIFIAIAVLVLAQVGWWTIIFMRDVDTIASLKTKTLQLEAQIENRPMSSLEPIEKMAARRRFMFLSESVTFAALTCFGLFLLFHALKAEHHSREIQKNFIEVVTHESKTPLTALKLRLESLKEKRSPDPELLSEVSLSLEEVRRLSSIFEKALSWNRMERYTFHFEIVPLAEIVEEVTRRLEPFFQARNVRVTLDLNPEAMVKGDSYGLQNTVQSLLENAVLYNDKDVKEVRVAIEYAPDSVLLSVQDNGPGVPVAERSQIFERFYRGKNGRRVPGTGLGLYIAKTIVEAHQGALRIAEGVVQGTRFEIFLPRAEAT